MSSPHPAVAARRRGGEANGRQHAEAVPALERATHCSLLDADLRSNGGAAPPSPLRRARARGMRAHTCTSVPCLLPPHPWRVACSYSALPPDPAAAKQPLLSAKPAPPPHQEVGEIVVVCDPSYRDLFEAGFRAARKPLKFALPGAQTCPQRPATRRGALAGWMRRIRLGLRSHGSPPPNAFGRQGEARLGGQRLGSDLPVCGAGGCPRLGSASGHLQRCSCSEQRHFPARRATLPRNPSHPLALMPDGAPPPPQRCLL